MPLGRAYAGIGRVQERLVLEGRISGEEPRFDEADHRARLVLRLGTGQEHGGGGFDHLGKLGISSPETIVSFAGREARFPMRAHRSAGVASSSNRLPAILARNVSLGGPAGHKAFRKADHPLRLCCTAPHERQSRHLSVNNRSGWELSEICNRNRGVGADSMLR